MLKPGKPAIGVEDDVSHVQGLQVWWVEPMELHNVAVRLASTNINTLDSRSMRNAVLPFGAQDVLFARLRRLTAVTQDCTYMPEPGRRWTLLDDHWEQSSH